MRAWSQSYWRMQKKKKGHRLRGWRGIISSVSMNQKQHSGHRPCGGKDVLKCARRWPEWLVPWELSPLLRTPQFVKETLQWDKNTQLVWILFGSLGRQKLSEGVPQRLLKVVWDNKGNAAFNSHRNTFHTLLSPQKQEKAVALALRKRYSSGTSDYWVWRMMATRVKELVFLHCRPGVEPRV